MSSWPGWRRRWPEGPRANGFGTEMWTLARVGEVIERITGMRDSQTGTSAILRERLGWSRQAALPRAGA